MKPADVLRNLIRTMGDDSALDEALRISALAYLDKLDPPEQNEQKAEQKPEKPAKIDTGKIKVLREAGWTLAGIAREMGCSQQTVSNHLTKMGMK